MSKTKWKRIVWGAAAALTASGFWLLGRDLRQQGLCAVGLFVLLAYLGWLVRNLSGGFDGAILDGMRRIRVRKRDKEMPLTDLMASHSFFHLDPHTITEKIDEIEHDYSRQFNPLAGTDLDFDREMREVGDRILKQWLKERKRKWKQNGFLADEKAEFAKIWALTTGKIKSPFK